MKLSRVIEFIKLNTVLLKFYALFGYFCLLFYFLLHWKVSENYIARYLPEIMAESVAMVLKIVGISAHAVQQRVQLPGFSFTIIYHCAGIFGMMIYASAVIAYPARFIEKIYGLVVGIAGLYLINTVRMAALGIIGMKWRTHFDFYHEYLWQGIFIIFVIGFWMFWKEKMIRTPAQPIEPSTGTETV
ncbi:archaeosortase/exosortase family protein [bacterium]|nr:archaeosortase/exosortase family protein [candidate division CSSED10-310 bacterium]